MSQPAHFNVMRPSRPPVEETAAAIGAIIPLASPWFEAARQHEVDLPPLGNPELPVFEFSERIVDAVHRSQAVIITAETGAGKSTQVPQYLADAGYRVLITQPRVVAARTLAERVSEEVIAVRGAAYENFVGYRTGRERGDNPDNRILYVTDGLQQIRELSRPTDGKPEVLVLDEVHEWNENMEILVAYAKKRMNEDPTFKVVVMSATMEAGSLSAYFADGGKREVPIFEVPGRTYPVEMHQGSDVTEETIRLAREGKNTLVFVPGEDEINMVVDVVAKAAIPGAVVLPLHGKLEASEQRKAFERYDGAKVVVATNAAQTSITIEDIDAVVDSGLERRSEVRNGVKGLFINPISQADCRQRAGRAGRTKEGEYYLSPLKVRSGDYAPYLPLDQREAYGTPEILRTLLDGMVLRLAKHGLDAETLDFYHQPENGAIATAKKRLYKLGALSEDGRITKIGRDMERMPVESHHARMMVEARKYGPEVQGQLAAALGVQSAEGIVRYKKRGENGVEGWRKYTSDFNDSDLLKQLEVFAAAQNHTDIENRTDDIFVKAMRKAQDTIRQLRRVERLSNEPVTLPTAQQREQLVKCLVAGMVDNIYIKSSFVSDEYIDDDGDCRTAGKRTMVTPAKVVLGTPFDLEITTKYGPTTLNLINDITNVPSVDVLREVAPQLYHVEQSELALDEHGTVTQPSKHTFNGRDITELVNETSRVTAEQREFLIYATMDLAADSGALDAILQTYEYDAVVELLQETLPDTARNVHNAMGYLPYPPSPRQEAPASFSPLYVDTSFLLQGVKDRLGFKD